MARSRSAEARRLVVPGWAFQILELSQAIRRIEMSSLENGSMAGGVKGGGSMVRIISEGTKPSCVAHDQKEDRLVWMLAIDLGASLIFPLGETPSGSDK